MTLPVRANISTSSLSSSRLRASWYYDDDNDECDQYDDIYSSSLSTTTSSAISFREGSCTTRTQQQQPQKVFCWGGWILNLVAIQTQQSKQQQAKQLSGFTPVGNLSTTGSIASKKRRSSFKVIVDTTALSSPTFSSSDEYDSDDSSNSINSLPHPIVTLLQHDNDTIESLQEQADLCIQECRLSDALHIYQRLLELHRATGQSPILIGKIHYQTGMIQYKRKYYDEALSHFDQALFIYQLNYDLPEYYDQNYNCDSNSNDNDSQNDMAIDMYQVYYATGHVHLSNQNPYRAIDYFKRAMQFVVKQPSNTDTKSLIPIHYQYYEQVLFALGAAHEAIGDAVTATNYYNIAKLGPK